VTGRLLQFLSTTLVALLVLFAVLLGAARLLAPALDDYKNDIADLASHAIGRNVTIQHMQAGWRGLSPVIKLVGVRIASHTHPEQRLDLGEVWIRVDLRGSLLSRELRFSGIDLLRTDFTLVRDSDGNIYLAELPTDPDAPPVDLTAMARLSLRDSNITLRDLQGRYATQTLHDVTLVMRNDGDRHTVSATVHLPDMLGRALEVEARLQGTAPDPLDWQGQVYLRGQNLQLTGLLQQLWPDSQPVTGVVDIRCWAELDAGRPVSFSSELDVSNFTVQSEHDAAQVVFAADRLRAQLGWQRRVHGWQAVLQHFRLSAGDQEWNTDNLSVAALTREQTSYLHALATHLPLQGMRSLLALVPDPTLRRQLLALQPAGQLEDVDVTLRQLPETVVLDHFSARFRELAVEQSGAIPALAGLSGSVQGTPNAGVLQLDSAAGHYADARLFRTPLPFDRLQGELHWQDTTAAMVLASEAITLENAQLATRSRLRLELPHSGAAPQLSLQVAIPRLQVSAVHDYLPARIMAPSGVSWLDRSLLGGEVHDGSVVIEGRLDQLPFDHGEGRLEVRLPVTGATLDFDAHWSPVEELDAQVDFTGRQMDIRSRQGRIRSAPLHDVHAQILDLQHPHLTITGDVTGALAVMLTELGSSPLGETYGGFVDRVSASGDAGLSLDINVPLEKDHLPITVAGKVRLQGNGLSIHDSDIALAAIRGELDFSEHGLSGDGLAARLFNKPVRARVWTEATRQYTRIELNGALQLLDRVLPKDDPLRQVFQGDSDWQVLLTVRGTPARGQRADVGLEVRSTLAGTAIDLPAPFGKPAESTRELSVRIDNLEQDERELLLHYADALDGVLLLGSDAQGMKPRRGTLTLGGARARLPNADELLVNGELAQLRLEDWQPHLAGGGAPPALPLRVDLKLHALEWSGQRISDTELAAHTEGGGWLIHASGANAQGDIRLHRAGQQLDRVQLAMKKLRLDAVDADAPAQSVTTLQPQDFPNLQVDVESLVYHGVNFGKLQLNADRRPDGRLDIHSFALQSAMLALHLSGEWYVQDEHARTRVDLTVTGGQLGKLLDALGYEKIIKDGDMTGSLQASWPGAPWEGRPEKMDGKLSMTIKNGQLLDVEPGATGRALGLLSIGKLPRRLLALDFTDLFGAGFGFDRVAGDFVLDSGNAWMDNLVVDGPAAKIDIAGRAGLQAQDYDEVVTVTPYLNSSLPLAGALAGGPAVGAAVIVAEKLLEKQLKLNEVARKQYTVTGSWSDPVITPLTPAAPVVEKHNDDELFE
jgi:uncharacterized protein (TIGR02099 family)